MNVINIRGMNVINIRGMNEAKLEIINKYVKQFKNDLMRCRNLVHKTTMLKRINTTTATASNQHIKKKEKDIAEDYQYSLLKT